MSKVNEHTGDRITNALKGDKEAYRENWEAIFGDKKKSLEEWAEDAIEMLKKVKMFLLVDCVVKKLINP